MHKLLCILCGGVNNTASTRTGQHHQAMPTGLILGIAAAILLLWLAIAALSSRHWTHKLHALQADANSETPQLRPDFAAKLRTDLPEVLICLALLVGVLEVAPHLPWLVDWLA